MAAEHRVRSALRATRDRLSGRTAAEPASGSPNAAPEAPPTLRTGLSLARYAAWLPERKRRRVAMLVPAGVGEELWTLLEEFADDDVYVLAPAASPDWGLDESRAVLLLAETVGQLNWLLKSIGPVDLLVDLWSERRREPVDVWRTLFFHLRARGVYVLASAPADRGLPAPSGQEGSDAAPGPPGAADRLASFLARHWRRGDPALSEPERELVDSCARFVVDRNYLLVEKRQTHLVKLRDAEVGRLLPQRNTRDTVTVLESLPQGELVGRGEVVSHPSSVPIPNLPERVSYPELHLHHYEGKLGLVINSLLYGDGTVLPGSFRYPLTRTLGNPRLIDVTPDFARLPDQLRPRRRLPGVYYHLDAWNPGHFGHVITEVVSRLWGWPRAKAEFPELKAVFRRRYPNERRPELELALFTAYGIPREDIVWLDEPVWLGSVLTATPMWQNEAPYYVHPDLEDTWRRLRAGLATPGGGLGPKIFVSRRAMLGNRLCRNVTAVEEVFRRYGFAIVYPEELDFGRQASVFGDAEVVAGLAGSGLYNILYSGGLSTLIVLAQEAYTARYEHLYGMLLGGTTHYFWSTPDIPHPVGGWSEQAYYSAWDFDFDRNGAELEDLLAGLA